MDLFRFIPREEVKGDGDAVTVHQEPHFHDRVWAVVLFRPPFAELFFCFVSIFINRVPIFIQDIHVGTANIIVIIRTVEVRNGQVTGDEGLGMVKNPFLKFFSVRINKVQAGIDIIKGETAEFFKKEAPFFVSFLFGGREQNP